MTDSKPRPPFVTELTLQATPDQVWRAIADATELTRWFPVSARVEPKEGGELTYAWGDLHTWKQQVVVWEPGQRLCTRYDSVVDDGEGGKRPLFIDFRLEGKGGHTRLRLVHHGFGPEADFAAEYDGIRRGWPVELESLRLYVERHAGTDRQLVWEVVPVTLEPAAAWAKLTGTKALACGASITSLATGSPFAFSTACGDRFEGVALHGQPQEFAARLTSHGDAFLRFCVESCSGKPQAWLWFAGYGRPDTELAEIQRHFAAMLQQSGLASAGSPRPASMGS